MKFLLLLLLALLGAMPQAVPPDQDPWPREINAAKARVVMYQPQIESSKGDRITARAAVGVTETGKTAPVFGAVWLSARMASGDDDLITFTDIDIPAIKFPEASKEDETKLTELLKREVPTWNLTISKEKLVAALALAEREKTRADQFKVEIPEIVWRKTPTVLIVIDGEPVEAATPDVEVARVVNTATFIARHVSTKAYYLFLGDRWATSMAVTGPWTEAASVPAPVMKHAGEDPVAKAQKEAAGKEKKPEQLPEILVATKPTELIVTDGEPKYVPVAGTGLLYIQNTDADVIREISSQSLYLLLSGRWFRATSQEGPWSALAADKLPPDFAKIPAGLEDLAPVRASVAGTPEAEEAVLSAQVPKTAAVPRAAKDLQITYDGAPKWVQVEGSAAEYATNTASSVFRVKGRIYCCQDAVWYEATGPNGPWAVATSIPVELNQLPASCPSYHCSYVYIYDSTPEYVWVGYTPGYVGCYIYGPTIIYGTGWYYPYWYGHYYYPRPVTYGVGVYYNPVYGHWGVSVTVGRPYGWVSVGWSSWGGGYVAVGVGGCVGWRGYAGHTNININAQINIHNTTINTRTPDLYRGRNDVSQKLPDHGALKDRQKPSTLPAKADVADRANNVVSDRDGNVFKKDGDAWSQRDKGGWDKVPDKSSFETKRPQMDRELQQRNLGQQRSAQNQSRPAGGSGGRHGGGRR
jgi:hypothetical protein